MLSIQDNCHLLSKVCNLIRLPNIPFQMKMWDAQGTGLDGLGISVWPSSTLPLPAPADLPELPWNDPAVAQDWHKCPLKATFKHSPTISTANAYTCPSAARSQLSSSSQCGLTPSPACVPALAVLQGRLVQQLRQKCNRWLWRKSVEVCSPGEESPIGIC